MKRFFQISIPLIFVIAVTQADAFARASCSATCIPVRARRDASGEKYYYPRMGWTSAMTESGRDRESALKKLEKRCDGDDELLVVYAEPIGPYGSLVYREATEGNACVGTWAELQQGPARVIPASFEVPPRNERNPGEIEINDPDGTLGTNGA